MDPRGEQLPTIESALATEAPLGAAAEADLAPPAASLGAAVSGGLVELQKDLENAWALAAVYQAEATSKSEELAALRQVFDRTKEHLVRLQISTNQLRDERHRLANAAMQTELLRRKLEVVTAELELSVADGQRLAREAMEAATLRRKLQALTVERDRLRQQMDSQQRWQD